jgi:hypothetical protein
LLPDARFALVKHPASKPSSVPPEQCGTDLGSVG